MDEKKEIESREAETEAKESTRPYKSRRPLATRLIALVVAVLMLLEVGLFNASTIRFLRESYAGSDYQDLANYLAEDDPYMSLSRLERMQAILNNMLTPETYDDYAMAASIAIANEDYAKAAAYITGCIELWEGDGAGLADLQVKLGCVYGLRDHWTMACAAFERAVAADAENQNAWLLLSEAQLRLGDYESALESVSSYQTLAPLSAAQYLAVAGMQLQLGRYEQARESCTAALALDDCDRADAYFTRAQASYLLDNAQAAAEDAQESIAAGNDSAEAKKLLAVCRDLLGDYENSLRLYRELIAAGERDVTLYEQAVQSAYLQGEYETQVSLAKEALGSFGEGASLEFYKWLGVGQIELEDYSGAAENLTRYLEQAGGAGELYYLRGIARLALEDYSSAEADFTAVIEGNASLLDESLYNRGLCRLFLADADGAAEDFQLILDRNANPDIVELVKTLLELE